MDARFSSIRRIPIWRSAAQSRHLRDTQAGEALDLVVVAPQPLAVLPQHCQLVSEDLWIARVRMGRVRVLRHQSERLPLATAADQDRRGGGVGGGGGGGSFPLV